MLHLQDRADLATMYRADIERYRGTPVADVVTLERFVALYAGCPSIGFAADGQPIGGMLFDGDEAHIAVLPAWHGRWLPLLRGGLDWLFTLRQPIDVAIERDNAACLAFVERCGWRRVRFSTDGDPVYRLLPMAALPGTAHRFLARPPRTQRPSSAITLRT